MPDPALGPQSFTSGTDRFFNAIQPYAKQGTTRFPLALRDLDTGRVDREPLHTWFVRIVDALGPSAPDSFALEQNLGLLATIKWASGSLLTYANVQAIVTRGSLVEYYCDPEQPAFYLRFDCDEKTLGQPFSHPHPHIHLDGSLSPRFAVDGGTSEHALVDFVEFLYRQYQPDAWIAWAERTWRPDFALRAADREEDPLTEIIEAFLRNRLEALRGRTPEIVRLKRLLRMAKEDMSRFRVSAPDRELLEYPSAR